MFSVYERYESGQWPKEMLIFDFINNVEQLSH